MASCVLRVGSKTKNVVALVKTSGLKPIAVFQRGQPVVAGSMHLCKQSGFNVLVAKADATFEKQVQVATRFLKRHAAGLARLRRNKNFGGMMLDFGINVRASDERPAKYYRLSSALIESAGKHGIEIELSFYSTE